MTDHQEPNAQNSHSSQTIMVWTIAISIVLTLAAWPLSMLGKNAWQNTDDAEDNAEMRIQPVARVELHAIVAETDGKPRSGDAVYASVCKACHETGLPNAPKFGDNTAWAPRLAQGSAALLLAATNGKNAMPARGGAANLSDDELKAAVDYLTGKAK